MRLFSAIISTKKTLNPGGLDADSSVFTHESCAKSPDPVFANRSAMDIKNRDLERNTMNRRVEVASTLVLLSALLGASELLTGCCQPGYPCQSSGSLGPSTGEIVGIGVGIVGAVAVGTVVAVNHSHHNLKGCVSSGPNGLQLSNDSDKKIYSLVGASPDVKAGERVKLHGTKQKKQKGNASNQQFLVDSVTKDLGPCEAVAGAAAVPNSAPSR